MSGRLEEAVRDNSISFVGIAGGDGTVRCAAEIVAQSDTELPLLVVPAGTRNHFACDVGVDTLDAAVAATKDGVLRSVDLGSVNGAMFVNNSSLGTYPNLVAEREEHERRLPKRLATVVAAWHQFRTGHRLVVSVDGVSRRVWAVFVGNNCYGETVRDLTGRERLDEGALDVRLARAEGKFSRLRIAGAVLFGRVAYSPLIERRKVSSIVIDVGGSVEVALDGEVVTLSSPLQYRSCPGALSVLVPPAEDRTD